MYRGGAANSNSAPINCVISFSHLDNLLFAKNAQAAENIPNGTLCPEI